ncbi:MAG: ABC transporter permease [Vicinamibacteria bacterium]|nr:ABC transporter permease [Vicinamibacteria bacterium]
MDRGRIRRIAAVSANTFRESVRERILYNLVFFAIVVILAGLVLKPLSIYQEEKILKDVGLAAMDFFGTLIAIFVGVSLINKEIDRRSLYPLLAKPLGRGEFLIGKFCGLCFTLFVNISVMTVCLYGALFYASRAVDIALLKAILAIYLGLLLIVALAQLFSTVTSPVMAAVATVCLVVAGRYSDVIRDMREVTESVPAWLVEFLYAAIPNFAHFDLKNRVVYGDPVTATDLLWIASYALAYIGAAVVASLLLFRSKELT